MSKAVDIYKDGQVLLQLDKITHLKQFPRWLKWLKKKNPPANAGAVGSIPGLGRSPGVRNGNPLHILAWRIPGDPWRIPGGLQALGLQKVRHDWATVYLWCKLLSSF